MSSTNQKPAVSVIIPAYKVAPFIGDTLRSVLSQTFSNYEVIIINDGSPDTEQLEAELKPYLDQIIYVKQENRGAGAARNAGLRVARGEYVAFLDGDDQWFPNFFSESLLAERCLVNTSSVLARREPIIEVGLFDETIVNSQDFDLRVRLAKRVGPA